MGATQLRHFKLWYSGKLRNWELAGYELGQIKVSFQDAGALFPGLPESDMAIVASPVQLVDEAIEAKDSAKFSRAFEGLKNAYNG
jgi:hypothetical protein